MALAISEFIKNKKAIVVEDESAIAQLLKIHLLQMGFIVDTFSNAITAYDNLSKEKYDLCLLDWMMPELSGIEFLKKVRPINKNLKIMMVTAKADADSIVEGLDSGANDYLAKPFDSKVLVARVRNLMRHAQMEQQELSQISESKKNRDILFYADLHIDLAKHIVLYKGEEVHLTPSEFKLLTSLFTAQGKVLTRYQLISLIQGDGVSVTGRTVDTHVFALRKKIGEWSQYIETIRGVGYRILISDSDKSESADTGVS